MFVDTAGVFLEQCDRIDASGVDPADVDLHRHECRISLLVESLIGTIRRECLDRTLLWTAADLEQKLLEFQRYFNGHRTHAGLGGRTPEPRTGEDRARASVSKYLWQLHCRGLCQTLSRHDPCATPARGQSISPPGVERF